MQCTLIVKLFLKIFRLWDQKNSNHMWKSGKKNGKEMMVSQFIIFLYIYNLQLF
jgi:hypothetical protein